MQPHADDIWIKDLTPEGLEQLGEALRHARILSRDPAVAAELQGRGYILERVISVRGAAEYQLHLPEEA